MVADISQCPLPTSSNSNGGSGSGSSGSSSSNSGTTDSSLLNGDISIKGKKMTLTAFIRCCNITETNSTDMITDSNNTKVLIVGQQESSPTTSNLGPTFYNCILFIPQTPPTISFPHTAIPTTPKTIVKGLFG